MSSGPLRVSRANLVALLVSCALLLGCDSSSSPTGVSTSPFAGSWVGATSQGESLRFAVADDGNGNLSLVSAELGLQLPEFVPGGVIIACFSDDARIDVAASQGLNRPFDGRSFSVRFPEDLPSSSDTLGLIFLLFEGELESAESAMGTLVAEATLPFLPVPCVFRGEATWTAGR